MAKTSSPAFIDFRAIKAAVTMEQVLNHYRLTESFTRSGDSLSGPCPIHHGTNPTQFRVSTTKNIWNCFSDCHGGGNVLDFVCRMENLSVREGAIQLAEWFNVPMGSRERRSNPSPAPKPEPTPPVATPVENQRPAKGRDVNKPLGFALKELTVDHPYLAERGLTPETITEFGLGLCNAGTMLGRIVIPIHNVSGQLVGYAGRWPGDPPKDTPKYKLPKGFRKSAELFNLHRALDESPGQPLIIVEGTFDVFHLWQLGFRKTIALLGSSLSEVQERLLADHLPQGSSLVLMLDEDEAGRKARNEILARLAQRWFTRLVVFPEEGMQPDHLEEEALHELLGGECAGSEDSAS